MTDDQAILTGVLIGLLMKQDVLDVDLEIHCDNDGCYFPQIYVTMGKTGAYLRLSVEVWDADDGENPPDDAEDGTVTSEAGLPTHQEKLAFDVETARLRAV